MGAGGCRRSGGGDDGGHVAGLQEVLGSHGQESWACAQHSGVHANAVELDRWCEHRCGRRSSTATLLVLLVSSFL